MHCANSFYQINIDLSLKLSGIKPSYHVSLLGRQIQQTTTRTKTFARGIQNKQFTQVRYVVGDWGGLKIEVTVRIIHSHAFF